MCGIVAYIGKKQALPIIINGLKKLEYRGYDSAGVAVVSESGIAIRKKAGKVADLERLLAVNGFDKTSTVGFGHTRWATHGEPNDLNAHPIYDDDQEIIVIHNGIIENYNSLKIRLEREGYIFRTETDTECLVHLIRSHFKNTDNFETSVRLALNEVEGAYGICVLCKSEPGKIIAARNGSPLVLGVGEKEFILASDATAIIPHTRQVVYLLDGEMVTVTCDNFSIKTIGDEKIERALEEITFDLEQIEKGGYEHFMHKEICEQPESIMNTLRGRIRKDNGLVKLGGLTNVVDKLAFAKRIIITACGTAWHAGLVGEYMIEQMCRIPVEVEYASEFRYRDPIVYPGDSMFVISQSGETADTRAALKEAKKRGADVYGIVNVVGSTIARETDAGIYTHAGPEIGVASTKAFTSQLTGLALISLLIAQHKSLMPPNEIKKITDELLRIPDKIKMILDQSDKIKEIAKVFKFCQHMLYLGRGYNFPVALEGALKLKEISYIHAEGYPAAEMKHGPIALIDANMPVIVIAPKDSTYDKIISNIREVKARKGVVISISDEHNTDIDEYSDYSIKIPSTCKFLSPILTTIPLQLFAYNLAVLRGCNVDQPRNLAKSVTVE
ncbi:MAG: glutamine--fructose-6-phosphate transaminase (isomerizing) [Ignavibacteriae bacterium]|nr:MAG: glutamine--fructose-6-phosphate transaminase (isomerizing) [Ignavibacteriota bacterium]